MTTYIQNKGITQTVIQNDNYAGKSEIKWDADYDGNIANIKVDTNDNKKKNKYRFQLNNSDLADLLSMPTVKNSLEYRLQSDYLDQGNKKNLNDIFFLKEQMPENMYDKEIVIKKLKNPEVQYIQDYDQKPLLYRVKPRYKKKIESLDDLSIMNLTDTNSLSTINALENNDSQLVKTPRLMMRDKIKRLKTPRPKTIRIHYKTPVGLKKQTKKRTVKKTKKNKESFFNQLF